MHHQLPTKRLRMKLTAVALLGAVSLASISPAQETDAAPNLAQYYGFLPTEIFKMEWRSHSMVAGDFNHDGKTDVAVVDDSHSRIDLLVQKAAAPASPSELSKVNDVRSHWRFEKLKVPVDREVPALSAADMNGDGRTDLVYFGNPDRLVIRYQPVSGEWTEKKEFRLADVTAAAWTVATGDLNNDTLADIAVLGKKSTYVCYQQKDGTVLPPVEFRNTGADLGLGMVQDLDGDGRNDLFYLAKDGDERVLCGRIQDAAGRLGPEIIFGVKNPRGVTLYDIDGQAGAEVLAIDSQTNRLRVLKLKNPRPRPGEPASRLVQYGVGGEGRETGEVAIGDLDGDNLADVAVTVPGNAQVMLFRQQKTGGLDLGTAYPSYLGVQQIQIANLDGKPGNEVVVLSSKENTLGIARFEEGRLSFPETLATAGTVVAFDLVDFDKDGSPEIVALFQEKSGRAAAKYSLGAIKRNAMGDWEPYAFAKDKTQIELKTENVPERLMTLDANRDGRPDLLGVIPGKPPILLLTSEAGVPEQVSITGGVQLGELDPGSVYFGQLEEPAFLVAQGSFARNMRLDENNRWQVRDQFNSTESNSKLKGVATLDLDNQPGNELVLIDTGLGKLRMHRLEKESYVPWREVDIGKFPYKSVAVADFNNDRHDDLLLFGAGRFGVLYSGQTDFELEEVASFESSTKDAFLMDLVAGDLNSDGRSDIALMETEHHTVQIVTRAADGSLKPAIGFKVYEEKGFGKSGRQGGIQPREGLIADVTGDGRADLLLLSHDRILLYPQDPGEPTPTK
jgi:hypothetical protein